MSESLQLNIKLKVILLVDSEVLSVSLKAINLNVFLYEADNGFGFPVAWYTLHVYRHVH
jgi:hypothetical protein